MKNNELKIMVPKGWSLTVEENPEGGRVFTFAPATAEYISHHHQKDVFKLVRASELSLSDDFLKYLPKTHHENVFKGDVEKIIKAGVQDFYRPTMDPSFDVDGQITYKAGMEPAVGKTYNWWYEHAKKYCPERNSRLGTYSEYIAFLAVLIKELVASGKSTEWAWNAVCNESKELGHYNDSSDAKNDFESTGNREVCGWRDLANTSKILEEAEETGYFWEMSGYYKMDSDFIPLAVLCQSQKDFAHNSFGTGWLVLS